MVSGRANVVTIIIRALRSSEGLFIAGDGKCGDGIIIMDRSRIACRFVVFIVIEVTITASNITAITRGSTCARWIIVMFGGINIYNIYISVSI